MPPQLEKNHVVPTAWQDEALARDGADSMDTGLGGLRELVMDREAWRSSLFQVISNLYLVTHIDLVEPILSAFAYTPLHP